jgi:chaperonin GroEL
VKEKDFNVGYNAATIICGYVQRVSWTPPRSPVLPCKMLLPSLGMVLTTECIVVDKPEPKEGAAGAGAGMGGDFDY